MGRIGGSSDGHTESRIAIIVALVISIGQEMTIS